MKKWKHPGGKLRELGAESLTDAELLAILISTGTKDKSAEDVAGDILDKSGSLKGMATQPLGIAEQETVDADRKQPDIVIFESPKSERVLCLIELKPPYFSPFDEKRLE